LLLTALDEIQGERILCTSLARAQFAAAVAKRLPAAKVICHLFDVFLMAQARETVEDSPPNLEIVCEADFPEGECDVVALPFLKKGESELTRELLQQGHERLRLGGRMLACTDNPRDQWLHEHMQELFDKVTRRPGSRGVLYSATKTAELKRRRDFAAEFAFRDGERLIKAVSRPSVFSHRELDVGSRALLESLSDPVEVIRPGMRILDLGCGAGAVGLALALRAADVHVHAVDSNPRALQCTARGAELNGLRLLERLPENPTRQPSRLAPRDKSPLAVRADNVPASDSSSTSTISTQLDADGRVPQPGSFDLVVANPPYFSNWRIATIFIEAAGRALKPGGVLYLVTKNPDWYLTNLPFVLSDVEARPVRQYSIVTGQQRGKSRK
jgi:23S rRNA (guanine1835-N2)-methyltransferase